MKSTTKIIFGILILLAILIWAGASQEHKPSLDQLRVWFFDIGQGDSAFIETPDKFQALIDGGPDDSVLTCLGKVMSFGDREINLVILTHPDADHLTGLIDVLQRYKVDQVIETGVNHDSARYQKWKDLVGEKNINDKIADKNEMLNWGQQTHFEILYPMSSFAQVDVENLNDTSIVGRLDFGEISVLFTGDAEEQENHRMVEAGEYLASQILKVSHHGSKNGTTSELLDAVRPEIGIISVGKDNRYGHPAKSILDLLDSYKVQIYRTDINGTIELISDGKSYSIETEK